MRFNSAFACWPSTRACATTRTDLIFSVSACRPDVVRIERSETMTGFRPAIARGATHLRRPSREKIEVAVGMARRAAREAVPGVAKLRGNRAAERYGLGKALHHQRDAGRRHQVVLDLDDLAFLAMVEAPLFEPIAEVRRDLEPAGSLADVPFGDAGIGGDAAVLPPRKFVQHLELFRAVELRQRLARTLLAVVTVLRICDRNLAANFPDRRRMHHRQRVGHAEGVKNVDDVGAVRFLPQDQHGAERMPDAEVDAP